jgi:shikimate kinase
MKSILLTGFMAAGKSHLGLKCSAKHNLQFFDTDQLLEKDCGQSIKEFFFRIGEEAFREIEHEALKKLIATYPEGVIIAAGGGAATYQKNSCLFKKMNVVFLDVGFELIKSRLADQEYEKRPLLKNISSSQLKLLFNNRRKIYFAMADYVIKSEDELKALICKLKEEENYDG